jgi:hypothetical protein
MKTHLPSPSQRHALVLAAAAEMFEAAESCTMRVWTTRDGAPGQQRR